LSNVNFQIENHVSIVLNNASENNLKGVSLDIPHHQFVVVAGVSGSGKSSLVFDVIAKEGQRRYFETLPTFSSRFIGKLSRPLVEDVSGLSAVISLNQKRVTGSARSTVGTISDIYDYLRLIYARFGHSDRDIKLSRSLFSFNSEIGQCKSCKGLGLEEEISLDKLVVFPERSLREGALAPTLPNGYIMYSQVTVDVLDQVCQVNGFSVDIPWTQLSKDQKNVILYGCDKIKVPFGKHSLESRLKWTGIVAKPRENGFYKGMMPIMSDILKRDRNANILKYVEAVTCKRCNGNKLNDDALSVLFHGKTIVEVEQMELHELKNWLLEIKDTKKSIPSLNPILAILIHRIDLLTQLGLGYLTLNRSTSSLSGGEFQRIRLINQLAAKLSNVLYVFDEPSIGLHERDRLAVLKMMKALVDQGNSVIVVEHDLNTIRNADWIIDVGPGAGVYGGEILFNGSFSEFIEQKELAGISATFDALNTSLKRKTYQVPSDLKGQLLLKGCSKNNLKQIDAVFQIGAFNVVTGVSGAGKSSLVQGELIERWNNKMLSNQIQSLIEINQKPIGRTPRSNPATYIGLADKIRDLFSKQLRSKELKLNKSAFSFNSKGGRCETCLGAGKIQIGMHFLGNVDLNCSSCNGKRFHQEVLQVQFKELNISEVFELKVLDALHFFKDEPSILKYLNVLDEVGLSYLALGQASTTLSGGEAQRVKLASELLKGKNAQTLYIIDEPSIGLHHSDMHGLIRLFKKIVSQGNTIVCVEHNTQFIQEGDWIVDLGPDSGKHGGKVVFQGLYSELIQLKDSYTAKALRGEYNFHLPNKRIEQLENEIRLTGVYTNQLKHIDVSFPKNKMSVVTGVSGSGKSSLVFDTLLAESQTRFTESLSTYARSLLRQGLSAKLDSSEGLTPVISINRKSSYRSRRSTVGTITSIWDHYRLLYSRLAQLDKFEYSAQHFSFNHQLGACSLCKGIGTELKCSVTHLVSNENLNLEEGCFKGNKTAEFYSDWNGQFMAILRGVALQTNLDLSKKWKDFSADEVAILLYGTADIEWEVTWKFKTKSREGEQKLKAKWLGFCNYIDDEYDRRQDNKQIENILGLLEEVNCSACQGKRLRNEMLSLQLAGMDIIELGELSLIETLSFFQTTTFTNKSVQKLFSEIAFRVIPIVEVLLDLDLGYLTLNRCSNSLSGGEDQRVRLAGQLAAKLVGVTYLLDEPTVGLHERSTLKLLKILRSIVEQGNTVILIEHDEVCIQQAEHILEIGPGAGKDGGELIYSGNYSGLLDSKSSIVGPYLKQKVTFEPHAYAYKKAVFGIKNAFQNNLKGIDLDFISGGIIVVKGPSGSGKSSLIDQVLVPSLVNRKPIGCKEIYGDDVFEEIVYLNQNFASISKLSTLVSYVGVLDYIQKEFVFEAKNQGGKCSKNLFSYTHKDGKCFACNGSGVLLTSMDFMSDVQTICEVCNGTRFQDESLAYKLDGLSIADVLELSVNEAVEFFSNQKAIIHRLNFLVDLGLSHLVLGQSGNTFSSGEIQRLQLAKLRMNEETGIKLYVFDEPSTGLHFKDIALLIKCIHGLVGEGHTVLFIEHHPQLIRIANQVISLGPESGKHGGEILDIAFKG
jgi:excinuclease ABC subunit A